MKEEKCWNCRFNDGVFCRRNAPVPLLSTREIKDKEQNWRPTAWFPEVGPDEWCGEYQSKEGMSRATGESK